jgi:hypothetical protein
LVGFEGELFSLTLPDFLCCTDRMPRIRQPRPKSREALLQVKTFSDGTKLPLMVVSSETTTAGMRTATATTVRLPSLVV